MARNQAACAERGYTLPPMDDIVFAKTTMAEESGAAAYTFGTQVYLGEAFLEYFLSDDSDDQHQFDLIIAHELFHCLTRNHPDFRAAMYAVLGFTVEDEDYEFGPEVREVMFSNPDVEHHNAHAAFDIDGKMTECVLIWTFSKPFEHPGDIIFDNSVTGLVPIDDLSTLYTSEDAANFWEVFGENTFYVTDPEEALADNFALTLFSEPDGEGLPTPEIIQAIGEYLKTGVGIEDAA